jgi:hypothetical protein
MIYMLWYAYSWKLGKTWKHEPSHVSKGGHTTDAMPAMLMRWFDLIMRYTFCDIQCKVCRSDGPAGLSWKILKVFVQVLATRESRFQKSIRLWLPNNDNYINYIAIEILAACSAHSTETSDDRFSASGRLTIVPDQGLPSGFIASSFESFAGWCSMCSLDSPESGFLYSFIQPCVEMDLDNPGMSLLHRSMLAWKIPGRSLEAFQTQYHNTS